MKQSQVGRCPRGPQEVPGPSWNPTSDPRLPRVALTSRARGCLEDSRNGLRSLRHLGLGFRFRMALGPLMMEPAGRFLQRSRRPPDRVRADGA